MPASPTPGPSPGKLRRERGERRFVLLGGPRAAPPPLAQARPPPNPLGEVELRFVRAGGPGAPAEGPFPPRPPSPAPREEGGEVRTRGQRVTRGHPAPGRPLPRSWPRRWGGVDRRCEERAKRRSGERAPVAQRRESHLPHSRTPALTHSPTSARAPSGTRPGGRGCRSAPGPARPARTNACTAAWDPAGRRRRHPPPCGCPRRRPRGRARGH